MTTIYNKSKEDIKLCGLSKKISYLLRHNPKSCNLILDEYGYCNVNDLTKALNISLEDLDYLVNHNTRFIYNKDKSKIKAAHGHSINVKYENKQVPPDILYHGTGWNYISNMSSILKEGLKSMSRIAIHLTSNKNEAIKVAKRHGKNVDIIKLDAKKMYEDGYVFYKSEDNVWLVTKDIEPKYFLGVD